MEIVLPLTAELSKTGRWHALQGRQIHNLGERERDFLCRNTFAHPISPMWFRFSRTSTQVASGSFKLFPTLILGTELPEKLILII